MHMCVIRRIHIHMQHNYTLSIKYQHTIHLRSTTSIPRSSHHSTTHLPSLVTTPLHALPSTTLKPPRTPLLVKVHRPVLKLYPLLRLAHLRRLTN